MVMLLMHFQVSMLLLMLGLVCSRLAVSSDLLVIGTAPHKHTAASAECLYTQKQADIQGGLDMPAAVTA